MKWVRQRRCGADTLNRCRTFSFISIIVFIRRFETVHLRHRQASQLYRYIPYMYTYVPSVMLYTNADARCCLLFVEQLEQIIFHVRHALHLCMCMLALLIVVYHFNLDGRVKVLHQLNSFGRLATQIYAIPIHHHCC